MDNKTKIGVLLALVDTVERTTEMENVYNDKRKVDKSAEHFSWAEVHQAVAEMIHDLKGKK